MFVLRQADVVRINNTPSMKQIDKNVVKMSQTNRYHTHRFLGSFVKTLNQN